MEHFSLLNYGAIALAALVKVLIGVFWYSPFVFGKQWVREARITQDDLVRPLRPLFISIFSATIIAFAMATVFSQMTLTWLEGMAMGIILSLGFVATSLAPQFAFEGRSGKLYIIHNGENVLSMTIMGGIIAGLS